MKLFDVCANKLSLSLSPPGISSWPLDCTTGAQPTAFDKNAGHARFIQNTILQNYGGRLA